MENNKILIGIQFTENDAAGKISHTYIELYVVRDITLMQLLDGVKYGLAKLAKESPDNRDIYKHCFEIYAKCISDTSRNALGQQVFKNITFTSFNAAAQSAYIGDERFTFSLDDTSKQLCELGFITSSRIIFDATGAFSPRGMLDTDNIIEAFNPKTSSRIFFPEYNISTRQMFQFDATPVEIIAPADPPQKPNHGLLQMLIPSILSLAILLVVRIAMTSMSSGVGAGATMIVLSVAMGIVTIVTTILNWKRQKKSFSDSLKKWRTQYENYIDRLLAQIKKRQTQDAQKLDELYPDVLTLINQGDRGVYSLNDNLYSRAPQDSDFLTFRIGVSNDVESKFEIHGDGKDVVFSQASFDIVTDDSGNDRVRLYLREEISNKTKNLENFSNLPGVISRKYSKMNNAPLLFSLHNKGALGIVDREVDTTISKSNYFISRMIFELCYYHSPEDLQFVAFFKGSRQWDEIEDTVFRYKFMPHFHGLFSDKSQFVFDETSASLVMSSLLTMMNSRQAQSQTDDASTPHVVIIVFEEHGLKEHALAEYLPAAPRLGSEYVNTLGLSYVFVAKHKEYLPAYCDDIVCFDNGEMTITPRHNVDEKKAFRYDAWSSAANKDHFFAQFTDDVMWSSRFLSSVYYAHIAQNGKVPSSVSMYEVIEKGGASLTDTVRSNWGIDSSHSIPNITESLRVPVGKTETGVAFLDLHEKADGPHMLVAGTTGSGKTETVISYLLGLCMQYRPDELNLLLVDMKGGGFTKRIGHLPHVVGAVTDVDGDENGTSAEYMLSRFLYAMKAEIKRRKLLFNKMHVDSIDAYIQACKDIEGYIENKKISGAEADLLRTTAKNNLLSHLILVVDEFTELKRFTNENSEIDFIGEITTIARVGRSLGFHIILISQNIEGAITEDIRVNSKARLCLKVATRQASKDMIGTELAASPFMPGNGRAYLLVGTGSKFEYFQSAYSGASTEEIVPVEITLASKTGAFSCFYRSDKDNLTLRKRMAELKKTGKSKTQLETISDAICSVYQNDLQNDLNKAGLPHTVFRAPLPKYITWDHYKKDIVILEDRKEELN